MSDGIWEMERRGNRGDSVGSDLNLADIPRERRWVVCIAEEEREFRSDDEDKVNDYRE